MTNNIFKLILLTRRYIILDSINIRASAKLTPISSNIQLWSLMSAGGYQMAAGRI